MEHAQVLNVRDHRYESGDALNCILVRLRVTLEVYDFPWWLLWCEVATQNDALTLNVLSKELDVRILKLANSLPIIQPSCTRIKVFLLLKPRVLQLCVFRGQLNVWLYCDRKIKVGWRLLILHLTLLLQLFSIHEVDLVFEHAIVGQTDRPAQSKVEVSFALVCQESKQRNADRAQESVLLEQDALALANVLIRLLVEQ